MVKKGEIDERGRKWIPCKFWRWLKGMLKLRIGESEVLRIGESKKAKNIHILQVLVSAD